MSIRRKYGAVLEPVAAWLSRYATPVLDLEQCRPVLVVGNQKTGSTAVAQLLALYGGLSVAPNVRLAWQREPALVAGSYDVHTFIQDARYYFRREVVKENTLTLVLDALLDALPAARVAFTMRHPVHNIRSILDRLNLPTTPRPLDEATAIDNDAWRRVIDVRWLAETAENHIESLAVRWQIIADVYLRNRRRVELVRYEDFAADKVGAISHLADSLEVPHRSRIQDQVDVQFQPRGKRRSSSIRDHFSDDVLRMIQDICAEGMQQLNYSPLMQ